MKPRPAYPENLEDLADAGFFEPVSIDYSEIEADSDVFKSSELPPLTMFGGVPDEIGKRNPAFVRFRRDDGRLILEGTVAKEVKKETMHRVARSLQWIDSVENHVEIDHRCEGLPGGDKGSGFLTALLEQAANGEIRIENDRVILSGEVYEAKTKSLLLSKALSFSDGRSVINHLKVIAPVLMVSVEVKPDSVHLRGFYLEKRPIKNFLVRSGKHCPGSR